MLYLMLNRVKVEVNLRNEQLLLQNCLSPHSSPMRATQTDSRPTHVKVAKYVLVGRLSL